MALDVSILTQEFLKLMDPATPGFVGYPTDIATAATNWANAYNNYAVRATDVSGDLVVSANMAGFITDLLTNLPDSVTGTIPLAANAFDLAFIKYWLGATFATGIIPLGGIGGTGLFSLEVSSVCTGVTAGTLSGFLQTEFSVFSSDAATKALALATCFHSATITAVQVLIMGLDTTPPPPAGTGPLPITNFGLVS